LQFAALQAQVALGYVQYEWTGLPEFNVYTLVVGSAQEDISDLNVEIYVDPVGGDDANPGTPTSPVQTFPRALALMPAGKALRRIYLVAGTYPIPNHVLYWNQWPVNQGEPVVVIGTPVPVALTVPQSTVLSSANRNRDITAQAAHAGSLVGAAIRFTSGAANGSRFLIGADTGTVITLNNRSNANVVADDTFVVERPGSILTVNSFLVFQGGAVAFKDVKFDCTSGGIVDFTNGAVCLANENVEYDCDNGGGLGVTDNATLFPESFSNPFRSPNPFSTALRSSCGLYVHGVDPDPNGNADGIFIAREGKIGRLGTGRGGMVLDTALVITFGNASFSPGGPFISTNGYLHFENSKVDISGRPSAHGRLDGTAVQCITSSVLIAETDQGNGPVDGVILVQGSYFTGRNSNVQVPPNPGVTVAPLGPNVGYGLNVQSSSVAALNDNGGSTFLSTGTPNPLGNGDMLIGATQKAYLALPYGEVDSSGPTGNRVNLDPNI
jgi:hypothetical protein